MNDDEKFYHLVASVSQGDQHYQSCRYHLEKTDWPKKVLVRFLIAFLY